MQECFMGIVQKNNGWKVEHNVLEPTGEGLIQDFSKGEGRTAWETRPHE